jgi:superfamily I DNA/RNA helicase
LLPYRAVVVDEAQDFHDEEWRLIRTLVSEEPNDLFIVGDAHQRIYGRKVVLGKCGINVRGRSSRLRINYRTTEEIRNWALAILHGVEVDDLDGGIDDQVGYTSLLSGPKPSVLRFGSLEEEQEAIGRTIQDLLKNHRPEDICVTVKTMKLLKKNYVSALERAGIPCTILDGDEGDDQPGVRLATMHRVKGLEFPCMILAGINKGVIPSERRGSQGDPIAQQERDQRERSLLFVAATRARDSLTVTCSGEASPYLAFSS